MKRSKFGQLEEQFVKNIEKDVYSNCKVSSVFVILVIFGHGKEIVSSLRQILTQLNKILIHCTTTIKVTKGL